MTADKTAPRLASIGLWLASAGYARAWRLKQHCRRMFGRRHLGCSRDVGAMGEPSCLAAGRGMAAHNCIAFFESP